MPQELTIEDILSAHHIGGGGSGDGIKIVKSPTQPTEGLRNGLVWINTDTNEIRMYIDGSFVFFGGGLGIIPYFANVVLEADSNSVTIPIANYVPATDILLVTQNTTQLMETIHYTVDRTTKRIVKKEGTWNKDTHFNFMVLAASPVALAGITLAVYESDATVPAGTLNVRFDIREYNPETDYLRVHQRNLEIFRNLDWTLASDKQSITLNSPTLDTETFHFTVQKKVRTADYTSDLVATKKDLTDHLEDPMPHYTTDGTKKYKMGFKVNPSTKELIFMYDEV